MISIKHPSIMNPWNRLRHLVAAWVPFGPSARLKNVLHEASSLAEADQDEANLPFWVADAVMEPENDLPELKLARSRFMRRFLNSAKRQEQWDALMGRAMALNSDHVLDHFTSVTGHSLGDVKESMAPGAVVGDIRSEVRGVALSRTQIRTGTYSAVTRRKSQFAFTSIRALADPVYFEAQTRRMRRAGSRAVVSAVSVYLILIMIGSWEPAVDPVQIATRVPEYSWLELGSTPRGRLIPRDYYVTQRYKVAVRKLRKVNTSILGYLPGYRKDLLYDGITEMQKAIAFQRDSGYVYPEALLLLADAYLKAGQPERAIPLVNQVIVRNERQATEARNLRAKLRKQGLYPGLDPLPKDVQ